MAKLTIKKLCQEARDFSIQEGLHAEKSLFGVTDGKAVGTYLEHKFISHLLFRGYTFTPGNSASGIDFPDLNLDMKVTSIRQPQSSCPFKSARQKLYGLGYSLIVFAYDKQDNPRKKTSTLLITAAIFIDSTRTADFQTTQGVIDILQKNGNKDDLIAFMSDRNLPVDEIGLNNLADEIIATPPLQGYLTISNALQWRLQYTRVLDKAGSISGIKSIYNGAQK